MNDVPARDYEGVDVLAQMTCDNEIRMKYLCKYCDKYKPLADFPVRRSGKKVAKCGAKCKACISETAKKNPTRRTPTLLKPQPMVVKHGLIYFFQAQGAGDFIKIGFTTTTLEARLRGVQGQSPLILVPLASIPGDTYLEMVLHQRFSHIRVHHEWFYPRPELLALIEQINHGGISTDDLREAV